MRDWQTWRSPFRRQDAYYELLLQFFVLGHTKSQITNFAGEPFCAPTDKLLTELVLDRLRSLKPNRITLDFDGSVQSTKRHAEGTAVGFNKQKKGARSYYPLFCTVAQTGQVFSLLHRSGNVHDSNGAREFILQCVREMRAALPGVIIEVRMDIAFFSDEIIMALDAAQAEFTISVPFERFTELKRMTESRKK